MNPAFDLYYGHDYDTQGKIMSEKIEWITTKEAAEIMGVAASNVRYLCKNERITCRKFGIAWQVSKQDAEEYVRSNRNPKWLHNEE